MFENKKFFVFDVNGTLLDKNAKIPNATWKFIKKIKDKGYGLGIVSSRPYQSLEQIIGIDKMKQFDLVVSHSGCRIDFGPYTEYFRIPLAEIDDIMDPENYVTAFSINGILYADDEAILPELKKTFKMKEAHTVDDLTDDVLAARLIFKDHKDRDQGISDVIRRLGTNKYNIEPAEERYVIVTTKEASRVEALRRHLQDNEIYYFADSYDDLAVFMNKKLHIKKIAPANAVKEIKELADVILKTTNDQTLEISLEE